MQKNRRYFYHFYILIIITLTGVFWGFQSVGIVPHYLDHHKILKLNTFLQISNAGDYVGILQWSGYVFLGIGTLIGGYCCDRFGRHKTLLSSCALASLILIPVIISPGVIGFILSVNILYILNATIFISAICYLAETTPASSRGRWIVFSKLMAALGIVIVYCLFYPYTHINQLYTNPMLFRFSFLILYFIFMSLALVFIPESPRWLMIKGKQQLAIKIFKRINNAETIGNELAAIESIKPQQDYSWLSILKYRRMPLTIFIVSLVTCFILFSEIDSVLRYTPYIILQDNYEFPLNQLQLNMIFVGIYTFGILTSLFLVDVIGRRKLVMLSVFGMIFSYLFLNIMISFTLGDSHGYAFEISRPFVLIFFFSIGSTAILSLILCEYFPTPIRGKCISIAVIALIISSFITRATFSYIVQAISFTGIYWLSTFSALIYLALYNEFMPETNNMIIDHLQMFPTTDNG